MTARAIALVAGLAACGGGDEPARPLAPPMPDPAARHPDPNERFAMQTVLDGDEPAAATGDPLRGLIALRPVRFEKLVLTTAIGDHVAGLLQLHTADRWCDGYGLGALASPLLDTSDIVGVVHVARPISGASPIEEGLPWAELAAIGETVRATLWIDRRRRWIDATFDLALSGPVGRELMFATTLGDTFEVTEIAAGGQPLTWRRLGTWLAVDLGERGARRLHLRMRGTPAEAEDWITTTAASLDGLLPVVLGGQITLDVTVHVPDGDRVDAIVPAEVAPSAPGWHGWRLRGRGEHLGAIVQADGGAPRTLERGGVRWTVRGPAAIDDAIARAVDVLAPLGPPAQQAVRVIGFAPADGPWFARSGAEPAALVPWTGADPIVDRHAVAAAVAARWLAAAPGASHQPCAWPDVAAAVIATWTLDDAGARAIRQGWIEQASDVSAYRLDSPGPVMPLLRAELCARGALVWSELERKLGRPAMIELIHGLRTAMAAHAGWRDVADALARGPGGDEAAAWLRDWIDRPLPPTLGLLDVTRDAGGVDAVLLQNPLPPITHCDPATVDEHDLAIPPYRGPVTIAAMAGAREVARVEVTAGLAGAAVHFAPDPTITLLVVDPDARLPLRAGNLLAVTVP